jgi:phage gp36-like protein
MPESLTYTYTTAAEIVRVLGQRAVDALVDDNGDGAGESGVLTSAIEEATDTINFYCYSFHTEQVLANNLLVRRWATYLACHILTQRRGNAGNYASVAERIVAKLELVHSGRYQIPRAPVRADCSPSMSNYVIDDRAYKRKLRVDRDVSTGPSTARQFPDVVSTTDFF